MGRSRRLLVLQAAALAAILGGFALLSISASARTRAHRASGVVLGTEKTNKLGKVIDYGEGRALYMFGKDTSTKSDCTGTCSKTWQPLTGKVSVGKGSGLNAHLLGKIKRSGGQMQVTYNHHPLYRYSKDTAPGDIKGEGASSFGGHWYLLNAKGNSVKPKSKSVCNPLCPGY